MKPDFYTLPKAMYSLDAVKTLLVDENNSILYKKLTKDMLDMEKIIVSHSIVYVISGHVEIQTYEYEKFTVDEGEMLFMPRDSYLISDYITAQKDMEVYLFFFDYALSAEFLSSSRIKSSSAQNKITKLHVSNNTLNYLNALKYAEYKDKENAHLLKIKIFELLHLLCESNQNFIHILNAQEAIKTDIESYMLTHYDKNLSVHDWAMLSGYSLSTFNRKFKKAYSISPKKWITQQNMKLANEALQNGLSVSECAAEFGYANSSNFIKAFKEIYKTTPKQYSMT
jgi:AraC-like DNA-binding protein